ncbi:MAG TPA: hypothetical protein VFA29_05685 [Candidatus Baltobacteraceae bacterium]|nr:hypothetical protein [Candidatus Baltobacteraceae bacterium]
MTPLLAALAALFVAGAAIGLYAWRAPRAVPVKREPPRPIPPLEPSPSWTAEAGEEFAELSESARCDLIFAVSDLNDERSARLLEHALNDPSDAVALAAAHALGRRGAAAAVSEYARRYPGERAERILATLALMQ